MRQTNENPARRGFEGGGGANRVHKEKSYGGHSSQQKRLAPYARHLDQSRRSICVLTGSRAWERAESRTWFDGCKLVLPLGDDPASYRWPVAGRDCILYSFGTPEPRERLITLSVALVKAGALFVTWSVPGDAPTTFFPGRAAS
jgi:hypothetical protein